MVSRRLTLKLLNYDKILLCKQLFHLIDKSYILYHKYVICHRHTFYNRFVKTKQCNFFDLGGWRTKKEKGNSRTCESETLPLVNSGIVAKNRLPNGFQTENKYREGEIMNVLFALKVSFSALYLLRNCGKKQFWF